GWGNQLGQALAAGAVACVARRSTGEIWSAEMPVLAATTPYLAPVFRDDHFILKFRVPRRAGGLFVADPVHLSLAAPGPSPMGQSAGGRAPRHRFFEGNETVGTAAGGRGNDYFYKQFYTPPSPPERSPLVRTSNNYLQGLLRGPPQGMEQLARSLLLRL